MPIVPGLNPNLRLVPPQQEEEEPAMAVNVVPNEPTPDRDNLLSIDHGDGSVTVSIDGRPVAPAQDDERKAGWFDNLVDKVDEGELTRVAEDLLRGITDDLESRQEWIDDRAQGIKLLGLKLEIPGLGGSADGAPVEGMSRVRHPLLLEAVLRFQANAGGELLPTDGPVKVHVEGQGDTQQQDDLADDLEADLNSYLTVTAREYYPDTDKMLLLTGFGGSGFKKVYFCPLRGRPVSESVDADDLIVNQEAKTLEDAKRITHRTMMRSSTVKRLQILKVYRDVDLSTPVQPQKDSAQREKASQQGIAPESTNPEDRDREIYECYCELDLLGFEHRYKGKLTGLEIPYRVTIDVSTRQILSIVRNYDEPTGEEGDQLPEALQVFVKYTFVPGLGFYDIGLLHILGNTTNAVTAAWREMLDAGMFANFPGFLIADTGARQNTNIFRVPPGGGAVVKTAGLPINQAVMPLPYKEPGSAMMTMVQNMVETGQRVGGTSELPVGEGRQDAPVGTTLALIEQATKVLNAVHRRLHNAQAQEFQLLLRCFRDHPDSFIRCIKKPRRQWDEQTLLSALKDYDLVPKADPNTASHIQRIMKIMALKQLEAANPNRYNGQAIDMAALKGMGWSNPEQFMATPQQAAQPTPEVQKAIAELQIKSKDADSRAMVAQAKVAETQAKVQGLAAGGEAGPTGTDPQELQLKAADLYLKKQQQDEMQARAKIEDENRDKDRDADLQIEHTKLLAAQIKAHTEMGHEREMQAADHHIDWAKTLHQAETTKAAAKVKPAPKKS